MAKVEAVWAFMLGYPKGWGFRAHAHDYYQMYYVTKGDGVFVRDGEEHHFRKGLFLLVYPGQLHELLPIKSGELRFIDCKFFILDGDLERQIRALPPSAFLDEDNDMPKLMEQIRNEWSMNAQHSKDIATCLIELILYRYLRLHESTIEELPFYRDVSSVIEGLSGLEERIAAYLAEHYRGDFSLDELAGQIRYSKNYLCKVFKRATGFTIIHYVNFLRVSKAYHLLRYSDDSITDIAGACGFASVHYFTRVFHRMTGMTPGKLRDRDRAFINSDVSKYGSFQHRYNSEVEGE